MLFREVKEHTEKIKAEMNVQWLLLENRKLEGARDGGREAEGELARAGEAQPGLRVRCFPPTGAGGFLQPQDVRLGTVLGAGTHKAGIGLRSVKK